MRETIKLKESYWVLFAGRGLGAGGLQPSLLLRLRIYRYEQFGEALDGES